MADEATKPELRESTHLLAMGVGIGAIGAASAIVGAAVCPVCVVATPALIGVGLYKRWREHVERRSEPGASDSAILDREEK